jgi:hypothetical protein
VIDSSPIEVFWRLRVGLQDADRPFFFISYAHNSEEEDRHVGRFFRDLDHDVQMFAGLRRQTVGFCDVSLRLGERWSPALLDALRTCCVFIPIMSPVYFTSSVCGKEWAIFESRMARGDAPAGRVSSLIPLLWVPMDLPPVARRYQHHEASLGGAYKREKLRNLIRHHRNDYQRLVEGLARRVVELSREARVPELAKRPAFHDVVSAFDDSPQPPEVLDPGLPPSPADQVPAPRTSPQELEPTRPILNPVMPNEESR